MQEPCVGNNPVLDGVEETEPNKAVILGIGGTGKSTLAATVASRPDIRRNFDTIFWIDVGKSLSLEAKENDTPVRNNLSYDNYRECLRTMCRQLEPDAALHGPTSLLSPPLPPFSFSVPTTAYLP